MAELADLSMGFIGMVERGTSSPTLDAIYQIAQALELKLADLMNLD